MVRAVKAAPKASVSLKDRLREKLFWAKVYALRGARWLASLVWRKALDRSASVALLQPDTIYQVQPTPVDTVPFLSEDRQVSLTLEDLQNPEHLGEADIYFEPDSVWRLTTGDRHRSLAVTRSGIALINQRLLLDLDFGNVAGFKESPFKRQIVEYPLVVAPWTHLTSFAYYGFVALVLGKLCRIEKALGPEIWQQAKVCYPLFNTAYEREYLAKLGIPPEAIVDTRQKGVQIRAHQLILANSQTKVNRVSPEDVALVRSRFCLPDVQQGTRRLFFPRRGKRVITNQDAVWEVLESFGFEVVEDRRRTVDEQIRLFQEAAFVVAPHGAGLTNLMWCQPGTKVLELFYGGYKKAGYYYLCKLLDLDYGCVLDRSNASEHFVYQYHDMTIDPGELRQELQRLLAN